MKSLLGHIVLKSTYQAENLATESLYYILPNSNLARTGLSRWALHKLPEKLLRYIFVVLLALYLIKYVRSLPMVVITYINSFYID